jgi:hypothetical protein
MRERRQATSVRSETETTAQNKQATKKKTNAWQIYLQGSLSID